MGAGFSASSAQPEHGGRAVDFKMIDPATVSADVRRALAEDIGAGDVTAGLIPPTTRVRAGLICREPAVLAGVAWFNEVFYQLDPDIRLDWRVKDAARIKAGELLCELTGPARPILSGERAALNFLQTLSGTATLTSEFVALLQGAGARLLDTRKTLPGLRAAQRYAVRCGGGLNHRNGLYDAILIKENHILAAGGIAAAVAMARETGLALAVEVESLAELKEALRAGAERVLLDNFTARDLKAAVLFTKGRARLEASGNINQQNLAEIAATGVDYVSIGALTKNTRAIDFSMRLNRRERAWRATGMR